MNSLNPSGWRRAGLWLLWMMLAALLCLAMKNVLYTGEMQSLTLRQRFFSLPAQTRADVSPITLVSIDNKTVGSADMATLFGVSFWSRSAHAYAIRFLQRTQTRGVIFDLGFNRGSDVGTLAGDQAMVQSLQGTRNFNSVLSLATETTRQMNWESHDPVIQQALLKQTVTLSGEAPWGDLLNKLRFNALTPPYEALLTQTPMRFYPASGTIFQSDLKGRQSEDQSGVLRRWAPWSVYGGHVFPYIALGAVLDGERNLTLDSAGAVHWDERTLHLGADGVPLIKWYGHGVDKGSPVYPEYAYSDLILSELVLECREHPAMADCQKITLPAQPILDPALLRDRYVVIGTTLRNKDDTHQTIYGPKYPGVYILTNILDNILHDDFVQPAPWWLNWGLFVLMLVGVGWGLWRFQTPVMSALVTVALLLCYGVGSVYAYNTLNLWIYVVYPAVGAVVLFIATYFVRYLRAEQKKQQLRQAFGKYVSPALIRLIDQEPDAIQLGGQRREMTLLFSDIRGFTTFSENNAPEVVQESLTKYFSVMNGIILKTWQGNINKLIGDAIMAYWGFPLSDEDHAYLAVRAAMEMRDAIVDWRQEAGNPPFEIGIGVNTGEVVIGNVGSEDFMDFTVIGDAVNVAARLESATKEQGVSLIISANTCARVQDRIEVRSLGHIQVKGKSEPIEIYEPVGLKSPAQK